MADSQPSSTKAPPQGQTGKSATVTNGLGPAAPGDQVLEALQAALASIGSTDATTLATTIDTDMGSYLDSLLPSAPSALDDDPCQSADLVTAGACIDHEDSIRTATQTYAAAKRSAETAFHDALDKWNAALGQYGTALSKAEVTLLSATKAVVDHYNLRQSAESRTRSTHVYLTAKEKVASALKDREASATSAAAAIATAAGGLLSAFATYVGALKTAQAALVADSVLAEQTLWQAVEGDRFPE